MVTSTTQQGERHLEYTKNQTIMVSGCTGFIGSHLTTRLSSMGYSVRGLTRKDMNDHDNITYVKADVFDLPSLTSVMKGVDVAYYLLHSMEGGKGDWQDFAKREKEQAMNFLQAANTSNVKRIIYLGWSGPHRMLLFSA